jgi:hypothetical protein
MPNTLSPGWTDTPLIDGNRLIQEQGVEQFKSQMAALVPMGRWGASDEIANAALFLASEDSSYITGVELRRWRPGPGLKRHTHTMRHCATAVAGYLERFVCRLARPSNRWLKRP